MIFITYIAVCLVQMFHFIVHNKISSYLLVDLSTGNLLRHSKKRSDNIAAPLQDTEQFVVPLLLAQQSLYPFLEWRYNTDAALIEVALQARSATWRCSGMPQLWLFFAAPIQEAVQTSLR